MIFGDSPKQGIRRGQTFEHPELKFRFEVPEGFVLQNMPSQVVARHPDAGVIIFDMEPDRKVARGAKDLSTYLTETWSGNLGLKNVERIEVNGMEAWTGRTRLNTRSGTREVRRVAYRRSEKDIFRFTFVTPPELVNKISEDLRRTTYSLKSLSDAEADAIKPLRITTRAVAAGESAATLQAGMAVEQYAGDWFDLINRNALADGLTSGKTVKMITE